MTEPEAVESNLRRLEQQLIRYGCIFETDARQLIDLIRKETLCPIPSTQA